MNMNTMTAARLINISIGAHATHPNEGAWMINAKKREALCLLALDASTWEEALRAEFLSQVMADTTEWPMDWALQISETHKGFDWDTTIKEWWTALRQIGVNKDKGDHHEECNCVECHPGAEEPVFPYGSFPGEI